MIKYIIFFLFLLSSASLYAQTIISGVVVDDLKEEVIGANVLIKNSYDGTSTELDGSFSFSTSKKGPQILQVSYLGFKDYMLEIELNGDSISLEIKLKPSAAQLKEIIITAGAFEASDEKKGVVLSSLDIVTTAGASADIAGALNTLPGTQRVGETGQLFVRGGAASETKTFIDGLRVQNPYNSSVPDVPARNRFSPFLFKGTLFSTGGYSAEYGQALSSALILNSTDLATETSTGISLMSIGLGLSHTHVWEKSSLSISGDYTNLGPYIGLVPQNRDWKKPVQATNEQLIFRHKISEKGLFKMHANYSKSWLEFDYADYINIGQSNNLELNNQNIYFNATYRDLLNDKWSYFIGTTYSNNDDDILGAFEVDSKEQSSQSKFTLNNFVNDNISIKVGAEYLWNEYKETYVDEESFSYDTVLDENYMAAFAESDVYFNRKLAAKIGVRFENSSLIRNWNLAPRVSLAYKTGAHSQISIAYGKFHQTPENELLRYLPEVSSIEFEKADHYILNYQKIYNQRVFRIETYFKKYNDLIKYENNMQWTSNNNGDGYATGVDLFFRDRKSIKFGDYWISYSYLDTQRDYLDFPEPSSPSFASKHNASLVYKHWLSKMTTSIGATYSFASGRPYNDPNEIEFNNGKTPVYQDLSFNASYLTNILGNFTVIFASITNIPGFNQTYGYRYSPYPDQEGEFPSFVLKPDAKRFFFIGMFINIGQTFDKDNQTKPD